MLILIGLTWLSMILLLYRKTMTRGLYGAGLPLAVILATSFEYIGGFSFGVPGYSHIRNDGSLYLLTYGFTEETVLKGLACALAAIVAFTLGVLLVYRKNTGLPVHFVSSEAYQRRSLMIMLAVGVTGIMVPRIPYPIPLAGAFSQVGQLTLIAAIAFGLHRSMRLGKGNTTLWLCLAGGFIAFYLIFSGFLSYGFQAFVVLTCFYLAIIRRRRMPSLRFLMGLLAFTYLALALSVAWLSSREQLRAVLWSNAGISERLSAISDAMLSITILNPFDFQSLDFLMTRFNHGMWVGKVIEHHSVHPELHLNGSGLLLALFAWVPRFIWPGKPEAGGSDLLSEHSGYVFSSGSATFGAGQVIDFYINFGLVGVVFGFFAMGYLIGYLDKAAGRNLRCGFVLKAAQYYVIGLCLTRSLSEVFFLISSGLAGFLIFKSIQLVQPHPRVQKRTLATDPRRQSNPIALARQGLPYD
ncbi:hypothetical protein [Aurantiacibacter rhizosphaerae]|uniref:Oligosaccharide repeat unit polymerase n=1 Tax=Aurantiacibacter rhizosphaerae TaxID=2691582 RepID=A0A844XAW8_9SPHN|nr:hypothetical protein [Aurantiacibacter rhizosphaerae]MWV26980.1 hypothetical protein [Aurantiacibacter rhizosphaerae]